MMMEMSPTASLLAQKVISLMNISQVWPRTLGGVLSKIVSKMIKVLRQLIVAVRSPVKNEHVQTS